MENLEEIQQKQVKGQQEKKSPKAEVAEEAPFENIDTLEELEQFTGKKLKDVESNSDKLIDSGSETLGRRLDALKAPEFLEKGKDYLKKVQGKIIELKNKVAKIIRRYGAVALIAGITFAAQEAPAATEDIKEGKKVEYIATKEGEAHAVSLEAKETGDSLSEVFGERYPSPDVHDYVKDADPEKVKDAQRILREAGYDIAVDGRWGRETDEVWREYQEKTKEETKKNGKKPGEPERPPKPEKKPNEAIALYPLLPHIRIVYKLNERGERTPYALQNKAGDRIFYKDGQRPDIPEGWQFEGVK